MEEDLQPIHRVVSWMRRRWRRRRKRRRRRMMKSRRRSRRRKGVRDWRRRISSTNT